MTTPVSNMSGSSALGGSTTMSQSKLNMQAFLQLMTSQLENQDPLNPMSDSDFFAQMAQLGQVEGMDELNNSAQVQQAQALMGQTVIATNPNPLGGSPVVAGVVQNLSIQNGTYYLGIQQLNGQGMISVPMSSLQTVQQTPNLANDGDLVGKTVTGSVLQNGQIQAVTGTVTGISMSNGIETVTLKLKDGSSVSLAVGNLTNISN
ncbi:MAG TPA: flagellar hook capping FlgD N-terminal domain-containing protein [Fimbriimonas sp.]|nr:flagellar hook capping FlgD N-terminal domain-containing protein [Fimbriimonas sp.]